MLAIRTLQVQIYPSRTGRLTVYFAFLLLFPGFFIYQTLLGLGIIPAVLGGYFSAIAIVFLGPLVWHYFIAIKANPNFVLKSDFYLFLFAIYYSFIIVINLVLGTNPAIAQKYVFSLIFCSNVYLIFRMLDVNDKIFMGMVAGSLLLMSAITMYFSIDGFFYLKSLGEASSPESLATYQGFARSYIYAFLLVVCYAKSISVRLVFYGLAAVSLFLNGARSEFSAVLFIIPVIELYRAKYKLYSVTLVFFLVIWLVANADSIVGVLPESRILQLFDLSDSSSGSAREQLSINAWRTIMHNPILGDFGSYPNGHYAHNILCAWVDFGFLGFAFFSILLLWPALRLSAPEYFFGKKSGDFCLAFSFSLIGILWALTAKAVPDMSIGAALGAYAKYRYGLRYGPAGRT